jgi:hypothetical protein
LEELQRPAESRSRKLRSIVDRIPPPSMEGLLQELIETNRLCVVGAEYPLETGVADFFDGVP